MLVRLLLRNVISWIAFLYINAGTAAAEVDPEALVTNNMLCKVMAKLSEEPQTFKVEAFHKLVNHFANKVYLYS